MVELLVLVVAALLVIAGATLLGPRFGVASPLLLVVVGVAASFLEVFADVHIDPEWVLAGLLPPLLYSSAVSMPSMNFRREFGAISGLSVVLVVVCSLGLGLLFWRLLPEVGFAWGVALGAILSPTDAVATSIVKGTTVSKRVIALLEGESLLNDATALVLLRTAIVATAATFSFWGAVGSFVWSVVVALVIGLAVGFGNLALRSRVTNPAVNTVLSFTVPFLASIPAELLQASGLVAAVVAGLVTGRRAPRTLPPQHRSSDSQNWHTLELVLEGIVFLTMGLQLKSVVEAVHHEHAGLGMALGLAALALVVTVVVRAAYVAPLLAVLAASARRVVGMRPRMEHLHERLQTPEGRQRAVDRLNDRRGRGPASRRVTHEGDLDRFTTRIRRSLADIDYFLGAPLGWREGLVVVWAGMRGAVTVAAAQTLPDDTPQRSVLVLIAFAVATGSLLVQGGTVGWLLGRLAPAGGPSDSDDDADERLTLVQLMRDRAEEVPALEVPDDATREERILANGRHRVEVIKAQREALLDARDDGTFDADVLAAMLANLDSAQIAIEMRTKLST